MPYIYDYVVKQWRPSQYGQDCTVRLWSTVKYRKITEKLTKTQ